MTDELLERLENCKFADDLCRDIAKEIRRLREVIEENARSSERQLIAALNVAKEMKRLREDNERLGNEAYHIFCPTCHHCAWHIDDHRRCTFCELEDKNAKLRKTLAAALDLMDKLSNPGTDWRVRPDIGDVRKFLRDWAHRAGASP